MMEAEPVKRYIARAIEAADSLFERLVFLGSLRSAYTGRYLHEGWAQVASAEEVHSVMKEFHESLFLSVLRLPVIELSKELRAHFRRLGEPEQDTCLLWLETEPFRDLVPRRCSPVLRAVFISQIRAALEVLRSAPDWAELAGPIALPHPLPDRSPLLRWLN